MFKAVCRVRAKLPAICGWGNQCFASSRLRKSSAVSDRALEDHNVAGNVGVYFHGLPQDVAVQHHLECPSDGVEHSR